MRILSENEILKEEYDSWLNEAIEEHRQKILKLETKEDVYDKAVEIFLVEAIARGLIELINKPSEEDINFLEDGGFEMLLEGELDSFPDIDDGYLLTEYFAFFSDYIYEKECEI